ncbi:hypothetical protein NP493_808g01000 [Ridgeia piscesae]|uniref:Delta-like protein n=1 Tax=Ridgeia piscesae TaxID=27915 RepID=A0AAD9KMZ0_RIDPI|nr:hypothetical protein NP493_808g01000 [Ridgeia piscesae]
MAYLVQGGAILNVQMVSYKNSGGKDWKNKPCDYIFHTECDHKFTFCFDRPSGNSNPEDCRYGRETTGEFRNENEITFDHDMASVTNPIRLKLDRWSGSIRFKVRVTDDDGGRGDDDLVDRINEVWSYPAARSASQATWHPRHIRGTRAHSAKTSLVLNVRVYCEVNYYTGRCDKFCKATDGPKEHYTCDPDHGDKVCRAGWEGTNCDIRSDDCINNTCTNGATCVDGHRRYTCMCPKGFTGVHCEMDIDDCATLPCKNGGTCIDQVAGYKCACTAGFVGADCSLSVCHASVSPCHNGGTCYVHNGSPTCLCPPAFTGDQCTRDKCLEISCENHGTCEKGYCVCRAGFLGHFCDVNVCETMQCLNGATCQDGVCRCVQGYTGRICQTQVNVCVSDPCQHKGTCRSHSDGGYHCRCLPAFEGAHCEYTRPTQPPPGWSHVTPQGTDDGSPRSTTKATVDGLQGSATKTTAAASVAMVRDSDARETSTRQSLPVWAIFLIVALVVVTAAVIFAFFVMRRRLKKEVSSTEAAVQFHSSTGGEGRATDFSDPDYDNVLTRADAAHGICNDCQGATPPPYTEPRTFATKTPPVDDAEVQNMSNSRFVNPTYEHPPPPRDVAAVAATAEAPALPIKAALRRGQEMDD